MKILFVMTFLIISTFAHSKNDGRFQLLRINEYPNTVMMIDTQTGNIWKQTCYSYNETTKECEVHAWGPEKVIGVNVQKEDIYKLAEKVEGLRPAPPKKCGAFEVDC